MKRRLYGRTRPGTILRRQIPVRSDFWDVQEAGYVECGLVSPSGQGSRGEFLYSLNLTDIASTWAETRAVMGKGEPGILGKLEPVRQELPFRFLGIHSEFKNHYLLRSYGRQHLGFIPSRPYKNDESNNLHLSSALRTAQGVDFVNFTEHLGPAFGWRTPELLYHPEGKGPRALFLPIWAFLLCQELVEAMEKHPIKGSPLGMRGPAHSWRSRRS